MTDATNTTPATDAAATTAPAPKLSRRETLLAKYNKLFTKRDEVIAELQELFAEITSIDALASIDVGSTVLVETGRADTKKTHTGVVIGVKVEEDGGKKYKVQYGEGFDADIVVVSGGKLSVPAKEAVAEDAAPVEQAA